MMSIPSRVGPVSAPELEPVARNHRMIESPAALLAHWRRCLADPGLPPACVQEAAFGLGLLTLECGESSLRFSPPLIVDAEAVDTAVRIFGEAVEASAQPRNGIAETGG